MEHLGQAVAVLALQLDYHGYAHFDFAFPVSYVNADGQFEKPSSPAPPVDVASCQRGFDFVLDSALRVQARQGT
jgi:hypothetical protein